MSSVPKSERKFDVVVFGATGFCGKLAAKYIVERYGSSGLKWAIAGRSQAKLEQVRQECKGLPEIILADSSNEEAVRAAVGQTKVFVTTAGPYSRYGSPVVKACAELGTDYCDITGETEWVKEMIALYDDTARSTGARIVHFCGHDCVPWDLGTLMLTKRLKERGEDLKRVDFYDVISGGVAGGTVETALGAMFGPEAKAKPKKILDYDPLLKAGETKGTSKTKIENVSCVAGGQDDRPARTMFFMAGVNAACVRRSNALLKYGEEITYSEGWASSGQVAGCCWMTGLASFGLLMAFPPTRCCIQKYCIPKPGEGPSESQLTAGYLNVTGFARGTNGGTAQATMKFINEDPGTQATARMLVEAALVFVLEKDFACDGGSYTPAACQGEALMKRLVDTGTTLTYKETGAAK